MNATAEAATAVSHQVILVLDFGSQYTQLIARRLRELHVYSEIIPFGTPAAEIARRQPAGVILSGGPMSVNEAGAPHCDYALFELGVPVLGICYGMQLMTQVLGGTLTRSSHREFGHADVTVGEAGRLFDGLTRTLKVWASHGDSVASVPPGFDIVATSATTPIAAIENRERALYGLLFHPEVVHTQHGADLLRTFAIDVCGCRGDWTMASFIDEAVARIRADVGDGRVVCGLSGGVDSTVAALLVHKAIGDRLTCIFVDNGLLREQEAAQVEDRFRNRMKLPLVVIDATSRFLARLTGVTDPEKKRKIIGAEFIDVFEDAAKDIGQFDFLAQGTLYPDVIESASAGWGSQVIKTHHNVGGLPERMHLQLIEPLRELFKDEVRRLGIELGLEEEFVWRHPFPGPGLAVRLLGPIDEGGLEVLRRADAIFIDELRRSRWYDRTWQAFAVLLPVSTVGVKGDERSYEKVIALRAVNSVDGMTADWTRLPASLVGRVANRIVNEVRGVNRVVYDCTSKPPATIEWE